MNMTDLKIDFEPISGEAPVHADATLSSSLPGCDASTSPRAGAWPIQGVVVGELVALDDDGATPIVRYAGQPGGGALGARSSVDLHGLHIGASIVLVFERGDPHRPVVIGVLHGRPGWPSADRQAQVEVDADGQRMVVAAREQLVLRCGKASITLTKAGKVLIEGAYLLSRATGTNRIKGGSIQLN